MGSRSAARHILGCSLLAAALASPCPPDERCAICPPGKVNITRNGTAFTANGEECIPCPKAGAWCPGGSAVEALEGWWAHRTNKTIRVYRCPTGACGNNNTCLGNRTGVVCGRCNPGWILEGEKCRLCLASKSAITEWRLAFGLSAGLAALLGYFILSWAPVFDNHCVQQLVNFLQTVYGKLHSAGAKKKEVVAFLSAPGTWRTFQQYAKILVGFLQVFASFRIPQVPSFRILQVPWLKALSDFMFAISGTEYLVVLDWMRFPGWSCLWSDITYETSLHAATIGPIIVAFLFYLPVVRKSAIYGAPPLHAF
jgi:hypothetical protein